MNYRSTTKTPICRNELRIENILTEKTIEAISHLYQRVILPDNIIFQKTKKDFEGDITLLIFPLTVISQKSPEETAHQIGNFLKENVSEIKSFNVIKGFLNLVIDDEYWKNCLTTFWHSLFSHQSSTEEMVMIEFSSPNTNKPLHLGHIRNNLLGSSLANILKANGKKVIRVNLVNDRGIHICKSMLAWKKWGNGETPKSSGMKGDHFVGKYYVEFDKQMKNEELKMVGYEKLNKEEAERKTPLMIEVQEMLRKWEAGDKETIELWKMMNSWVYEGFEETYKQLGIEFEKTYYESQTYLLGKEIVEDGLKKNIFIKKEDGSVWIDLTADGLDEKLLIRSDGTSVYMTQDLGTVVQRFEEYKMNKLIYVVGSEQEYHFKVLFLILKKLGYELANNLHHLSYGMVDLPLGKMKSREGTVVDADDLMEEMIQSAKQTTTELGKTDSLSDEEANNLFCTIGIGALKYFILKVDSKKRMLFDPKESIDFNGNTAPFIQYTYARIKSVIRKAEEQNIKYQISDIKYQIVDKEKEILKLFYDFPRVINESAEKYNPGVIANYVYELAKEYNQFYQEIPILKAESSEIKNFRLLLSAKTAEVIKSSLKILGIDVPERM
ncbi:MAG: arginine--tRNA ligase [Bacteroidota bacterium]